MSAFELTLLSIGSVLLALFLVRSAYPFAERRLSTIAERRSAHLKSDFMRLSSRKLLGCFVASGAVIGVASYLVSGNVMISLIAASIPVLFSELAVKKYRRQRRIRIVSQLPSFLETLSGYVKAGHSLPEGLVSAIPLLPHGIKEEISWLSQLNRLGTPLSDAFLAWEERMPSPELSLVARPMRIAISTGGNIVSLLERARDVLRARQRQQDKMQSMTAQGRLQALVLTMLPPIFLLVLSKMEDGFWDAITGTGTGRMLILTAGILQLFGWLFIRKILAIKL